MTVPRSREDLLATLDGLGVGCSFIILTPALRSMDRAVPQVFCRLTSLMNRSLVRVASRWSLKNCLTTPRVRWICALYASCFFEGDCLLCLRTFEMRPFCP